MGLLNALCADMPTPRPPKHYSQQGKPSSQPNQRAAKPKPHITPRAKFSFALGVRSAPKGAVLDFRCLASKAPILVQLQATHIREGLGASNPCPVEAASNPSLCPVVKGLEGLNPCPIGGHLKSSREGLGKS